MDALQKYKNEYKYKNYNDAMTICKMNRGIITVRMPFKNMMNISIITLKMPLQCIDYNYGLKYSMDALKMYYNEYRHNYFIDAPIVYKTIMGIPSLTDAPTLY